MILGITGSFGAGKSTVREIFAELGWYFFDADKVCHDIYDDRGGSFFSEIVKIWGDEILTENGTIDRKQLAARVFGKKEELNRLTGLLYPELDRRLNAAIKSCRADGGCGAFEIPLLFEKNYRSYFDAVLTVWSDRTIRYERLKTGRSFDDAEIRRRDAQQMDPDQKLELADFAVINNGSRELLKRQIEKITDKRKDGSC